MSSTDDRIVSMQFDNAEFERKLAQTIQGLDHLDQTIQMAGAKQGLTQVSDAATRFNTGNMVSALDALNSKFSAMGAIGFSAIQKLTQGFMGFVGNIMNTAKTDVLEPIITGGKSRAQALQQAKFQFEGLGMDVNAGMASALAAVKGTAFGLDEAATVAAQFGASGIKAGDDMTRALTGISGIASMTGRSYSEIGQIFTSMAGQGKVSSMDLMEFGIRGVNAAAAYGKETGQTEAQVRALVSAGKIGFPEFADAMDKAFGAHALDANQTYAGSLSNLHAAMSRMGASFFSDRLVQERDLFNALTPVVDALTKVLTPLTNEILKVSEAGNNRLIAFLNNVKLDKFSQAISNAVDIVARLSKIMEAVSWAIRSAFHEVFPANLASQVTGITGFFDHLFKVLSPGLVMIANIKFVFMGLFSTFSIVEDVLKGVLKVIGSFFGAFVGPAAQSAGGILVTIAEAMTRFNNEFVKTGKIDEFFNNLAEEAKKPGIYLQQLLDVIKKLFDFKTAGGSTASELDKVGKSIDHVSTSGERLRGFLADIVRILDAAWQDIVHGLSGFGDALENAFSPARFRGIISVLDAGLLGGILVLLKRFMDNGLKLNIGGGMFAKISSSLKDVTNTLKGMQNELKAKMLLEIAGAIGVLAISIVVLSTINPDALQSAMTAMAFGFAQLVIVMKMLNSISSGIGGASKLALLGTTMTIMAGSVVILATAVKLLSTIPVDELQRGLTGVAVALGLLIGAAKLMEDSSGGMIAAGIAMSAMATGLVIMAGAVRLFATMSWDQLIKGLSGIAAALVIIALTMKLMPVASTLAAGLAMIPLATGLVILAGAVRLFATMSWAQLAKGLTGLAAGLVIVAVAMNLMPLSLPITAAGLLLVAMALDIMVPAIKMMGNMSLESLAKGLGALALMLGLLVVALNAMDGALPGAAALIVAAGALVILTGVLHGLAELSWGDIIKGLVAIAGIMVVLGVGATLLAPVIPALLGLGAALTLVGAGFALFGAGVFLIATGFSILAATAVAGASAIVAALVTIIKAIPTFVSALVTSLTQSTVDLMTGLNTIIDLIRPLLLKLLEMIITLSPVIAQAIVAIITSALSLIRQKFPDVAQTAFDLLITFLKVLSDNLPKVVDGATQVIVALAKSMKDNAPKIVDAAVSLILSFLGEIAKKAGDIGAAGVDILVHLLAGIAKNIANVAKAAGDIVANFITGLVGAYGKIADAGATALVKFLEGVGRDLGKVATKATDVAIAFINSMANNAVRFANSAADTLVAFLNGLADAIRTHSPELRAAGGNIIDAIVDGMTGGISGKLSNVTNQLVSGIEGTVNSVKGFLGISSPSKVFMEIGKNMAVGLANGIENDTTATNSAVVAAEKIVQAFSDSLTSIPDSLAGMGEFNPVITPILDLTKVKATASGIGGLLPASTIAADVSLNQARTIASTSDLTKQTPPTLAETKEITFNQTINAPDALSTNDIYKNTKSQLALAKEELSIS